MVLSYFCFPNIILAARFCTFCVIFIVFAGSPVSSKVA